jgi:PAS domain S-box-containing protein
MERVPEQWKAGEVARLLAIVETERRYYQEIVSSIPVGVVIFSPELNVVSSNREARKLLGVRNGELWSGKLDEILPTEKRAKVRRVLDTGVAEDSLLVPAPGDPERSLRLSFRQVRNWNSDPPHLILLTIQDADTAQDSGQSDQEIPQPELLNSIDAMVWAVELPSKRFLFVNEKVQEVLGFPKEKWLGNPEFWSERIHPEDRGSVLEAYERSIQNWSRHTCEFRAINSYGKIVWLRESARLLQDEEGRARHLIGFGADVTQRLQLETERIQAQRIEALGQLAGRISHEIASHVAVIGNQSERVIGSFAATHPLRAGMGEVIAAAGHLRVLAAQLAAFNNAEGQTVEPVEITSLLARRKPHIERSLSEGLRFEMSLFPAPIGVRAAPGQLEEIITTLVDRARRNLSSGGRLTIECGPAEIDELLYGSDLVLRPGVYGVISVEDDGPTLEPQDRAAVFESFLPSGRSFDLGPALSKAYNLVRQWGGDILVSSVWPRGKKFQIYLPRMGERIEVPADRARREPEAAVREPWPSALEPRTRTILVVENDSSVRTLIEKMLRRQAYRVLETGDFAAALKTCQESAVSIDLMVADLMTLRIPVPEAVEQLRRYCPDVRILFLSGHPDEPAQEQNIPIPGAAFIRKPFTLGSLMGRVQSMLES